MLHAIYQVPFKPVFLIPPESFFKWAREKMAIAPAQEFRPFGACPMAHDIFAGPKELETLKVFPGVRQDFSRRLYLAAEYPDGCAIKVDASHGKTYSTPNVDSPVLRVHRPDGTSYEARE